jgi:hypothetical protein
LAAQYDGAEGGDGAVAGSREAVALQGVDAVAVSRDGGPPHRGSSPSKATSARDAYTLRDHYPLAYRVKESRLVCCQDHACVPVHPDRS